LKTAGFDTEAQLAVSKEAYNQHFRAPASGGSRRGAPVTTGSRP